MPFPVSITGVIRLSRDVVGGASIDRIAVRIEDLLDAAAAKAVIRRDSSVAFTAGVFRAVFSSNVLVSLDSGTLDIEDAGDEIRVTYHASTVQMLIVVTAMLFLMGTLMLCLGLPRLVAVWVLLIGWLWLFGMNYLITSIRFPRWLRHGLQRSLI
ncbi:MAG TPA: hypothetical protein VGG99_22770 [Acetobacteraceae bacterium]|jgi:hypothetical protein